MTWQTEERIVAPAAGAPAKRVRQVAGDGGGSKRHGAIIGFGPAASGPAVVTGDAITLPIDDLATMGRTARHHSPLGSPGAGSG